MEADSLTRGWKRDLYVIWVAEFVAIAGFSVVMPFLPYYVQELGVTDPRQVAIWSAVLFTGQAITMAIFAPLWGSLADRYGRKMMVERAMFGGALLLGAMGLVRNVQQLASLRVLQGCVTGTVPAATTLVASSVPRRRAGYALGMLQMAIYSGASAGPLLGGLIADTLGYRAAFWVTASLLFTAGLGVFFLVEEHFEPAQQKGDSSAKGLGSSSAGGFWQGLTLVLRSRALLIVFGTRVVMRFGSGIMGPMLPLFVQSLMPEQGRVSSVTGLITGIGAATSALGAVSLGRVSDRVGHRRVLVACALVAAALYAPQFFVTKPIELLILQGAVGVALGGILASVSATLANLAPEGRQGIVYGLDTSAVSMANSLAPMAGAAIATGLGLRFIFLCTAGIFALAALGVVGLLEDTKESKERQSTAMSPDDKAIALGHPSYLWRFGQDRRLTLLREYAPLEGKRILDVGCGLGMYVQKMRAFSEEVYGVDVDPEKVAEASQTLSNIQLAPAEQLPFPDGFFDVVLLHEVIEHVEDDRQAIREAHRVIKRGGRIVIFAPNRLYPLETHGIFWRGKYHFGNIPLVNYLPDFLRHRLCPHVRTYTRDDIQRLFEGLDVEVIVHNQIYPGYDKIAARHPAMGSLLRQVTYALEGTPLRVFGLSHFVVVEKGQRTGRI